MSFQWTAIAGFLYCEIAFVLLLLLPLVSAKRWKRIFQSNMFQSVSAYTYYYFNALVFVLALCFLDAIREMRKYNTVDKTSLSTPISAIENLNMKKFRAQRNFYIAGFSLFLWLVVHRLITLLIAEASLEERVDISETANTELKKEKEDLEESMARLTVRLDDQNEKLMNGNREAELVELQTAYNTLKQQMEQIETLQPSIARESVTDNQFGDGGDGVRIQPVGHSAMEESEEDFD